ncbi:monovalent cation/H+ antiporter subunit D family protein [Wenzhouxiangella sp. XN79A]|uniref:proton-conducting transporter transmembrane domain-containing protein n=1 Tax=Wenzhouxiangella sp. XN79A TaxID=2724193 RepID=UPI00144AE654|nr:monovalent cation/H+ antiporter subunit D family protein [Wenzhouxiangella sp. XN79A]
MSPESIIVLLIVVPLIGALLIALVGRWPNLREAVTLTTAVTLFAIATQLIDPVVNGAGASLTVAEPLPGLKIAFDVEPLGLVFALLASLLWIVTSVYAIGYMRGANEPRQTPFFAFFAVAISGAMGVATAGNLLTLFIFYEVLTLSTWPLVTHKQNDAARAGGRTYMGVLLTTSIGFLLPAIVWTWVVAGTTDFTQGGILLGNIGPTAAAVLLTMFVLGTGKAAVMPMHRWLPAAMVAPTPVSALLHAVAVVKAGVFTITKVVIYIFGLDFLAAVPLEKYLMYLAGFTIVAASIVALKQVEIKKMLAYSTISQLSYIVLAALVLAPFAEIGAAVHIVAHAFGKITLFFCAGAIYIASSKTRIDQLRGIGWRMPWTMAAFTVGALSMIGVPPTAGFVSKWYIIAGAFQVESFFVLAVMGASTALNAAYFLPIVFRAFFRAEDSAPARDHGEAPWPMVAALALTATLTILFFVFNGPVVDIESRILEVPK